MNIRKEVLALALVAAAAGGALAQSAAPKLKWTWGDKLEAVNAAPSIHKVLFEDGHIRLLEVTIHAGEKEPLHGHQYPSVFAIDAPQPAMDNEQLDHSMHHTDRTLVDSDCPVCRAMGVQAPHSVHITDSFQQHFYRLEFKTIDGSDIYNKP